MSGHQTTAKYWEGPLPILQWGQATLPNVPWPQVVGQPAAELSPPPDPAALRATIGTLIGRISKAANGSVEKRQRLLGLAIQAGRQLNAQQVTAAMTSIAALRGMLDAAEADRGRPSAEALQSAPQSLPSASAYSGPTTTATVSQDQSVAAQNHSDRSAQQQPGGEEVREFDLSEGDPDPNLWEVTHLPTLLPNHLKYRRKAAPATGVQSNAALSVGQPSVVADAPDPASATSASSPAASQLQEQPSARQQRNPSSNSASGSLSGKPNAEALAKSASSEKNLADLQAAPTPRPQPQPQQQLEALPRGNPPSNLVGNVQSQKSKGPNNDIVPVVEEDPNEVAARRAERDAAYEAANKENYANNHKQLEPELKSIPLARERNKIGEAVLKEWQTIAEQDSAFFNRLLDKVGKIGAVPRELMTDWKNVVACEGLEKTLTGARQQLDKLVTECQEFQARQVKAAVLAQQHWVKYSDDIGAYSEKLAWAGRSVHPRWKDYEQAAEARDEKWPRKRDDQKKHQTLLISIDETINVAIKHISAMQQVLEDPDLGRIQKSGFTVGTAVLLKEHNLRFQDFQFYAYNDQNIGKGSKDGIGKGACNTVDKIVYNGNGKPRYFKPEHLTDKPYAADSGTKYDPVAELGIDRKNPGYANRNIASSVTSKALGLQVIPEACVVVHNQKVGLLMDEAQGVPPMDNGGNPQRPWGNLSSQQVASLHGGLNGLEWCDVLTGQADRHPVNYHVDCQINTAKVTGIDNDRAFGSKQGHVMKTNEVIGFQSVGMPSLIDGTIYDKITAPGFKNNMMQGLQGLLTAKEIEATEARIDKVIEKVRGIPSDFVVRDWASWKSPSPDNKTATEYLAGQKSGSLFARDFAQFFPCTEAERQEKQKITQSEKDLAALQSAGR